MINFMAQVQDACDTYELKADDFQYFIDNQCQGTEKHIEFWKDMGAVVRKYLKE